MTKVLNLDELETSLEKVVVIKGVEYKMTPLSVEDFINQMKEIDEVGKQDLSAMEMYELSLRVILRAFPGLTSETLRSLNTFQIDALYGFLKERADVEADRGLETVNAGEQKGEASS